MKILIVIALLAIALPVRGAHIETSVSVERAQFMCTVGTAECPILRHVEPVAAPILEVKQAPASVTAATSTENAKIAQLQGLVEQLKQLVLALQAQMSYER